MRQEGRGGGGGVVVKNIGEKGMVIEGWIYLTVEIVDAGRWQDL